MRIILDMVPNHCGVNHPWFQTAQKDPKSLEAKFFTFRSYPDHYESWQGVPMLPKLNYTSAELRSRMFDRPNAVFRRWLKPPYRVDGYRIDVANMLARNGPIQLNLPTAAKIRQSVKASNPYAYLIGENFFDASDQLQGEHWDGVMNYAGFLFPMLNWLCGYRIHSHNTQDPIPSAYVWPTSTLEEAWRASRASIPWQVARGQFNLLGSHDTSRILTLLGGDTNLLRLAAILQFTYPGVPCIYYGDEVGMNDHLALASRGPMQWDNKGWNRDIQDFYRRLIWLRKTSPALRRGGFQMLNIAENSLVFQRQSRMQRVIVCANRGPGESGTINISAVEAGIPEGSIFTEAFTGRQALVRNANLSLPTQGVGATIWFG
jgi:alpha-glucosidase